jgi:hypothetical protein
MSEEIKKKVDDAWKDQVDKEKKQAYVDEQSYHEPTFTIFLSSLSMQAMIAAGKLANPVTQKVEKNLEQARFLIDTLGILKEKTKNNLSAEEEKLLDEALYSLRMIYVEEKGK